MLSDQGINGETYNLKLQHYTVSDADTTDIAGIHGYLYLKSVTKDYYWYQRSINNYYNSEGNPFAEPVVIYTNITNGRGIFYGSSADSFRFDIY